MFFVNQLNGFGAYTAAAGGGFPSVVNYAVTTLSSGDPITVDLPASIVSGNLLLLGYGSNNSLAANVPSGWTQLERQTTAGALFIAYRVADGTEGSTLSLDRTGTSGICGTVVWQIENYQGTPEKGTAVTGTSANPDPPSLAPSWGSASTLWLVFCALSGSGSPTVSSYPTNYIGGQVSTNGKIASAHRQLTASSDDPGTFTYSSSNGFYVNTVAVRGA